MKGAVVHLPSFPFGLQILHYGRAHETRDILHCQFTSLLLITIFVFMFTSAFFGVYIEVQTFPEHSLFVSRPIWASGGSKHSQREKQENGKAKYWNSKPMQAEPIQYVCEGEKTHMYIISWPWLYILQFFYLDKSKRSKRASKEKMPYYFTIFIILYERKRVNECSRPPTIQRVSFFLSNSQVVQAMAETIFVHIAQAKTIFFLLFQLGRHTFTGHTLRRLDIFS